MVDGTGLVVDDQHIGQVELGNVVSVTFIERPVKVTLLSRKDSWMGPL